jgi:hypothetical protein
MKLNTLALIALFKALTGISEQPNCPKRKMSKKILVISLAAFSLMANISWVMQRLITKT